MHKSTKLTLASIGIFLIVLLGFYGDFLPLRKSQVLIHSLRDLRDVATLKEFKEGLAVPLNFPSPIGHEEAVRNTANIILNLVQQSQNPQDITELVNFVEDYYKPIIARKRGMSFAQNLYILGGINELAFIKTQNPQFLSAAHAYFEEGTKLWPERPQFLYGMFDIYRIEGNVEGAKSISERILSNWPDDGRIKQGLQDFLKRVSSTLQQQKK